MKVSTALLLGGPAALVWAQSTTSGNNPLIPTNGLSSTCSSFLHALNTDPSVSACSTPLLRATSSFTPSSSPSTNSTTTTTTAPTSVTPSLLSTLCSTTNTTCDPLAIRTSLSYFAGNCSDELQAGNQLVITNYDVLYVLLPMYQATCAKDPNTGDYCALAMGAKDEDGQVKKAASSVQAGLNASVPAPSAGAGAGGVVGNGTTAAAGNGTAQAVVQFAVQTVSDVFSFDFKDLYYTVSSTAGKLVRRQATTTGTNNTTTGTGNGTTVFSSDDAALPNATTFRNSYLPFLFLNPNQSSTELCTPCTKSIVASYVAWETLSPYALGLAHSPLLGNQAKLWTALGNACGTGFLTSVQEKAGTDGIVLGAASRMAGGPVPVALAAVVMAAVMVIV